MYGSVPDVGGVYKWALAWPEQHPLEVQLIDPADELDSNEKVFTVAPGFRSQDFETTQGSEKGPENKDMKITTNSDGNHVPLSAR